MAKRQKQKKSIILRLLLLAFSIYSIVLLGTLQVELIQSRKQVAEKQDRINELTLEVDELMRLLENGTEEDVIEKAARERLGYVYADEQVFIDLSGN